MNEPHACWECVVEAARKCARASDGTIVVEVIERALMFVAKTVPNEYRARLAESGEPNLSSFAHLLRDMIYDDEDIISEDERRKEGNDAREDEEQTGDEHGL